jgi:hypothetical protein
LVRYPGTTGFEIAELQYAKQQARFLGSPMDPTLLQKFHNIRGVITKNDQTTPINGTAGTVTWDWIPHNFDAKGKSPIEDDPGLPGDNTQPAWTACLVTNTDRCVTVKGSKIDHSFLMNHTGVLEELQRILCPDGGAVSPTETPQPEPASDEEVVDFFEWLSRNILAVRGIPSFDHPEFRALVATEERFNRRLPNIARRFISDVMKRPGPKGLRPPEGGDHGGPRRGPDTPDTPKGGQSTTPAAQATARKPAPGPARRKSPQGKRS